MSYVPPKKNTAYICYISLVSQADTKLTQVSPTIAAGDFQVSIDGGALNNLATLPTVTPAAGRMVKISLSAAEMNGDNITVVCSDAAGAEWCDLTINIQTSVQQVDDLATPTNITAGTITTVTNLTNAPTSGDLTVTMKTSVTTACTASTPTAAAVTGAVGSVTGAVGSVTGAVGSVAGNVDGNVTGSVGSLGAQAKLDVNAEADTAIADALLATAAAIATVDGIVDAILLDTAEIGAAGAGLTALGDARLANLNATVQSRLATTGYTAPLDAAGTRTAVGLAAANLDTQLAALPTAAENATELLDQANGVEAGVTVRQALRASSSEAAGDITGTTEAPVFGAIGNPATPRITSAATAAGLRENTLSLT